MKESFKALWREEKARMLVSSAVILLPMLVGTLMWTRLPDPMARHFGLDNQPNGWSSKAFTVFGMPLLLLALHWLAMTATRWQHKGLNTRVRALLAAIIPGTSLLVMGICYGYALGAPLAVDRIVWGFIGLLLAAVGNYLPKTRPNSVAGIRLSCTMCDEQVWRRTHRFVGPVWVVFGLMLAVCGLIGTGPAIPIAAIAVMLAAALVYPLAISRGKSAR